MKKLFVCALLFGLLASVPAFAQKTYVNGIDSNYPPFAYVDEKTGQPAGFDIDAMNWIAKTMGFKVVHKPVAWDGIVLALANKQIDMIASGIVDPTKVTRSALQNAASVAAMVLTTESLVTDKPDPAADAANAAAMAAAQGGGMY